MSPPEPLESHSRVGRRHPEESSELAQLPPHLSLILTLIKNLAPVESYRNLPVLVMGRTLAVMVVRETRAAARKVERIVR